MAKAIGIHTLAEGVETREQMMFLRSIGCEMLQGYYYSKPMDSEMYVDYLTNSGIVVENVSDHQYWNSIGQINFLSPDPLNDIESQPIAENDISMFRESSSALALIEISGRDVKIQYANKSYLDGIKKIGYNSLAALEDAIENVPNVYYKDLVEQITSTLKTDKLIKKDHFANNIYFTYSTKCIAKSDGKYMIAASIRTYDPVHEVNRSDLFEKYSRVLLNTYDHVTVIDFKKDAIIARLFSKIGFPLEYTLLSLSEARKRFAKNEIPRSERDRFLRYFDYDSIHKHMEQTGNTALQQPFHIKFQDGEYKLMDVRIMRTTVEDGEKFLFIIQSMSPSALVISEEIMKTDPSRFTEW